MYSSTISTCVSPDNSPSGSLPSTPHTDRGVTDLSSDVKFSFDWWRVTVWASREFLFPLLEILGVARLVSEPVIPFKPEYEVMLKDAAGGGIGFRRREDGFGGFQLYSSPICDDPDQETYCSINIPAKALLNLGVSSIDRAFAWLCEKEQEIDLRWNTTRLDLAADTQAFSVADMVSAYHAGAVKTHSRKWEEKTNSDNGHTFYIGSRESERFVRVYHKMDGFSFGREPFTRVELELKGERAAQSFRLLMSKPAVERPALAGGLLLDFMTVDREWWSDLMVGIDRAWIIIRRRIPTIKRALAWLDEQVVPTLATVALALTDGDVDEMEALLGRMLRSGQKRLKKHHRDMIYNYTPASAPEFAVAGL